MEFANALKEQENIFNNIFIKPEAAAARRRDDAVDTVAPAQQTDNPAL